ncbi:MAG: phosphodiester glycosidase family protein [Patescibacteria group bacterium]|nr:phosphodiester glycosidase family protein [Patescibacteria group bacterium]
MKRLLFFILLLAIFTFILIIFQPKSSRENKRSGPTVSKELSTELNELFGKGLVFLNGEEINFSWFTVNSVSRLTLTPNFDEKISSFEFVNENACYFLANGGFYTSDYKPLGLLESEGKILSNFDQSNLRNGVFFVDKFGVAGIVPSVNDPNLELAVQSGPLLLMEGQPAKLLISNDEPRRRVLVSLDQNQKIVFLTAYSADDSFNGPRLKDLPIALKMLSDKYSLNLVSGLNLDGGSASAFYSPQLFLSEIKPVGSFFCVR